MLKDFRDYLLAGKTADLAIAVVLAVAFGSAIRSLVDNLVGPLLGVFGEVDFSELSVDVGMATIRYGAFLNDLIAFIVVALAVYVGVIRPLSTMRRSLVGPPVATRECSACLSIIPRAATRCAFCTTMQHSPVAAPQSQTCDS